MLFECRLFIYYTIPLHTIEEDEQSPWAISCVSIEQVQQGDHDKYYVCVKNPMSVEDMYFNIAKLKIYTIYQSIEKIRIRYLDFKKPKRVLSILFSKTLLKLLKIINLARLRWFLVKTMFQIVLTQSLLSL